MTSMGNANWITMTIGFVISMIIGILFILKPIQFWKKFAGVFGYAISFLDIISNVAHLA